MTGSGMATAALVVIGIILVVIGIFAGGSLPVIGIGVAAIAFAALLETWVRTRS